MAIAQRPTKENNSPVMGWGGLSNVSKCQKMSSCQKDVKCQTVKQLDYGGGSQKKIDIMRFTDIDINFDITYEGHQNWSKILSMDILRVFSDHSMMTINIFEELFFYLGVGYLG